MFPISDDQLIERRKQFSIIIAMTNRDDPIHALSMGVYNKCRLDLPELKQRFPQALRRVWPNARAIPFTNWHQGGRA